MTSRIALTWQVSDISGWGNFGYHLVFELLRSGGPKPLLLQPLDLRQVDPRIEEALGELAAEQAEFAQLIAQNPGRTATLHDTAMIHHMSDRMVVSDISQIVCGDRNVGAIFFETTNFKEKSTANAQLFETVIAGSTWNEEVLRANGIDNVTTVLQGVDTATFNIAFKKKAKLQDRFVVYSGGKLEFRKGQDIALRAFAHFHRRHPDALLLTTWHSPWAIAANSLSRSPHVSGPPDVDRDGRQLMTAWAVEMGVPETAFLDAGVVPNSQMPGLLRNVDVGLFPNRCEGGTNLVAMECLAMGVPCILSANTGHLDLIDDARCYVLKDQRPVRSEDGSTQGWGESSLDEIVEVLERAYTAYDEAKRKGEAAAAWMQNLSWANQVETYAKVIRG